MHKVYLGLGSNLGDRHANIERAIGLVSERVGKVLRCSSVIETDPWGFDSENRFLNAVLLCETILTPRQVLRKTQGIERDLGKRRQHATQRQSSNTKVQSSKFKVQSTEYHDRPIDIDILLYDDLTVDETDLQIPHPRMQERDFVMIPLQEVMQG
ncbi:MAG: 2-amino-4-hydroxy-6-hydroxymethyldihydropteridine diphosphokinase [Prevotella sp.]|nr:2-amino-4-hydroxy-6-hydroxymethyldihydropteridine diphosphokinase [Prevotella sp.]